MAHSWRMDVVDVMLETDLTRRLVRIAGQRVVARDMREAAKQSSPREGR